MTLVQDYYLTADRRSLYRQMQMPLQDLDTSCVTLARQIRAQAAEDARALVVPLTAKLLEHLPEIQRGTNQHQLLLPPEEWLIHYLELPVRVHTPTRVDFTRYKEPCTEWYLSLSVGETAVDEVFHRRYRTLSQRMQAFSQHLNHQSAALMELIKQHETRLREQLRGKDYEILVMMSGAGSFSEVIAPVLLTELAALLTWVSHLYELEGNPLDSEIPTRATETTLA